MPRGGYLPGDSNRYGRHHHTNPNSVLERSGSDGGLHSVGLAHDRHSEPSTCGELRHHHRDRPAIGSYSGQVTLACLSVSPIVTAAPYCSFDPPTVSISSNTGAISTLTITTFGTSSTTRLWNLRLFYAFWLAVPGLALVGARRTASPGKICWPYFS